MNTLPFVWEIERPNGNWITIYYQVDTSVTPGEEPTRDNPGSPPDIEWWGVEVTAVGMYDTGGQERVTEHDGLVFQLAKGLLDSTRVQCRVNDYYEEQE